MGDARGRRGVLAADGEGDLRGGSLGVLIDLHADQDAWGALWVDFHDHHRLSLDWAWEHLTCEQLWRLVRWLPPGSAWHRHLGLSTPLEENLATLLDLFFHQLVAQHRKDTFDPETYVEHRRLLAEAKRNRTLPPDIPLVVPIAIRPDGWASLTAALTTPPEPEVEEIEGHEAHLRLQALLNAET